MFRISMREESFASWLQVIGLLFAAVGIFLPVGIIVFSPPRSLSIAALGLCAVMFLFCVFAAVALFVLSHFAGVLHQAARHGFRDESRTTRAPEKGKSPENATEPPKSENIKRVQAQKPAPAQKETAAPVPVPAAQPSSRVASAVTQKPPAQVAVLHAKLRTTVEERTPAPAPVVELPATPLPITELSSPEDILSPDTASTPAQPPQPSQTASQTVDARGHSEAESMFESIKTFIDMEMWHLAYQRAKELIRKHPESQEAARLKKNLETFRKKAEEMLVAW